MAVELASGYVSLTGSAKGIGDSISKELGGPLQQAGAEQGKSLAGSLSGAFKAAIGIAGGVFAAREVVGGITDAINAARESNKVAEQTAAVLKSTGSAAGISAAQIGDLANALAMKTGIDDEAIQSGENLLLTFTNIRNEAGKGNDIFNQATGVITDMSAALGQDMKSSAIQLGKALNDPIQGVTALQRVGVSFTDQQKDQIKTLVESGHTLDAQKIILAELNKEFGGSAAAVATPMDRLRVSLGNLQESVGNALIPVLDKVATFLADKLPKAIAFVSRAWDALKGGFQNPFASIGSSVGGLERIFLTVGAAIGKLVEGFRGGIQAWRDFGAGFEAHGFFENLVKIVMEDVVPAFQALVSFVENNLKPILIGIGIVLLGFVPIGILVVGGLIALYERFQVVRDVVAAAGAVLSAVFGAIKAVAADLVAFFVAEWPAISEAFGHLQAAAAAVGAFLGVIIGGLISLFRDDFLVVVRTVIENVGQIIGNIVAIVSGVFRLVIDLVNGDWGKAWNDVKQIVGNAVGLVGNLLQGIIGIVRGVFGAAVDIIKNTLGTAAGTITGWIGSAIGAFASLPGKILSALGNLGGLLVQAGTDIINGLISGIRNAGGALQRFLVQFIKDHVPAPVLKFLGISSPSKLFADIGKQIPAGLIQGVTAGARGIEPALTGMFSSIPAMSSSALAAPAASGGSKVVGIENFHAAQPYTPGEIGRISARETAWAIKTA